MQLRDHRAVVTGAASGIGFAVARHLLLQGVSVTAVDVQEAGLSSIKAEGANVLVADLAEPAHWSRVIEAGQGVDYLVNCAGIVRLKPIFEFTVQDWRDIFALNAESVFFLCQGIGPQMQPGGAIVNMSSSSAKLATTIEAAIYAASKAAILSVTRSFAYALAQRPVRVNAICPGIIDTAMQDRVLEDVSKIRGTTVAELSNARLRSVPLSRAATAAECAEVVWFLLSPASAYMTGQAINYTGGLVMW